MTYRSSTYRTGESRRATYAPRPMGPRVNNYDAGCADCGHLVPVGTGALTGSRAAGWEVRHLPRRLVSHFPQDVKYAGGCEEARETQPVWAAKPARPARADMHRYGSYGRCEDAPCCGCCP